MRMILDAKEPILVVDDDEAGREYYTEALASEYEVTTAATLEEALAALREGRFPKVVTDLSLLGASDGYGGIVAREAKRLLPSSWVVITSGNHSAGERAKNLAGADVFLPKPFTMEELLAALQRK